MNDIRNGKIYASLFILFLVILGVGGFILTTTLTSKKPKTSELAQDTKQESTNMKIDSTQDYIYFSNATTKNSDFGIIYQDINLNINSSAAKTLENELNTKMAEAIISYKTLTEANLSDEELNDIVYKESDIYEAKYYKYSRYITSSYASVLSDEYFFDAHIGETYVGSKAYVFDLTTGNLLTKDAIFSIYNTSLDKIKNAVMTRLNAKQSTVLVEETPDTETNEPSPDEDTSKDSESKPNDTSKEETKSDTTWEEVEVININATLQEFDNDNYAVYIDKSGYLTISYLVKTRNSSYNDTIIIN